MSRIFSLAFLTGNGADPLGAVRIAADAGYDAISFRLLPASPGEVPAPLLEDAAYRREVLAALRDTGIGFLDAEMIRIPPGGVDVGKYLPFVETIAGMGARHINTVFDDPETARNVETFGRICEMAAAHGLTADLEFMPWTGVRTLAEARPIVEGAGHPAGAILFDCLHFDRTGAPMDELAAIPPGMINYAQVCDGPADWSPDHAELIRVARTARLIPGEGGIDLAGILRRLPSDIAVSVEVPNHALAAGIGRTALAARALAATKTLISDHQGATTT